MKRLVLIGVAVFVIALTVGTGARVALTPSSPKRAAAADSLDTAQPKVESDSSRVPTGESGRTPADVIKPEVSGAPESASPSTSSGGAMPAVAEATPVAKDAGNRAATGDATGAAGGAPGPAPAIATSDSTQAAEAESIDARAIKQMARILISMKTVDAGRIMAGLTDDQLESILRSLGVRQAASLLALLPTERAAALSRRLLVSPAKEGK